MQNAVRFEENVYALATSLVLYDVHVQYVRFILFDLIVDCFLQSWPGASACYSVSSFFVDRGWINKLDRLVLKIKRSVLLFA